MGKKLLSALLGTVGFVGSVVSILVVPDSFWSGAGDAIYPAPVVVFLAGALLLSWAYVWLSRRRPTSADQRRLDRLFTVLPRKAIRNIADQDFAAPWPDGIAWPVNRFVEDYNGLEEHFDSRPMEKHRERLFGTADAFRWAEANNGFPHQFADGFRNTGYTEMELEENERAMHRAEERGNAIRSAAHQFLDAHDDLIKAAKRRRYNLEALDAEPESPPWADRPRRLRGLARPAPRLDRQA